MRLRRACIAVLAAAWLASTPAHAAIVPQAGTVEILFTPGDRIDRRIVAAIDAARREVHVLAYSFTDRSIARALIAARSRGVRIEVVADRGQTHELVNSVLPELARRGIAVWLDGRSGSAHNKVVIVDPATPEATTITGSFNLTRAAQTHNAENVVIFHRNPDIARTYERYFESRRKEAQPWPPKHGRDSLARPHPRIPSRVPQAAQARRAP